MNQFRSVLFGFVDDNVELDDVILEINRLAKDGPSAVNKAHTLLKQLHDRGSLDDDSYQVFKKHLQNQLRDETIPVPILTTKTRITEPSVDGNSGTDTIIHHTSRPPPPDDKTRAQPFSNDAEAADTDTGIDPHHLDIDKPLGVGSILKDRFVLEKVLGQGGMGIVYKALDRRKEETKDREPYTAVKVLSSDFQNHPSSIIALQREAKKAQKLAHPNIVTVYDFDRDQNNVFMTMEYLEGEPLDKLIKRIRISPKSLEKDKALSYIEQMIKSLAYAHEQLIVHSDFKPGNVFITKSDVANFLDF